MALYNTNVGGGDWKLLNVPFNIGYPTTSTLVKIGIPTKGYKTVQIENGSAVAWTVYDENDQSIGTISAGTGTVTTLDVTNYDIIEIGNSSTANMSLVVTYTA